MNYLSLDALAKFIDEPVDPARPSITRSAKRYKPLRNAVCHTSLLTEDAKSALTLEFNNIKARLAKVLKEFQDSQKAKKKKADK